jgi:murein DD-endopeptidase MepM/ murein hydrolase activator NlpD
MGALTAAAVALADNGSARQARAAKAAAAAFQRDDGSGQQQGYVSVSGTDSDSGDGTSVRTSTSGGHGSATASAESRNVTIFDDLATAGVASVNAQANGGSQTKSGRVKDLVVNGKSEGTVTSRHVYDLGGNGTLTVLDGSGRGILALRAHLTRAYKSYPAGATVKVAYAAATARNAVAPPPPKPKPHKSTPAKKHPSKPHAGPGKKSTPKPNRRQAPKTRTLKTTKGFVFPVYGKHSFSDDWGAPRQDTGFHQGNDIFANAGTPVVAVCAGTLHRVGTRPVPGNRLWVKCDSGDEFFYGHLSAFASNAYSGAKVSAGQVVGFVGSTGDAEQTPPHLHFEVHPGGGDAVDPYPFLKAWESRRDVPAAAWVKATGAAGGEQPGALVVVRDFLAR